MGASDLLVSVSQRRLPCVIEPALALGHAQGPALALRLTRVFETWLTRSFWQVIDSSELLARSARGAPDELTDLQGGQSIRVWMAEDDPSGASSWSLQWDQMLVRPPRRDTDATGAMPDDQALQAWITMRDGTDAGAWTLRWLGDCVAESQLSTSTPHETAPIELIDRYELLVATLESRVQAAGDQEPHERVAGLACCAGLDPTLSSIDALALAASLDGALILCRAATADPGLPQPIATLVRAGMEPVEIGPGDQHSLFAAERAVLRNALAAAGMAPLTHGLPRLALARVRVDESMATGDGEGADPWQRAQAWWYWL